LFSYDQTLNILYNLETTVEAVLEFLFDMLLHYIV